MNNIEQSWIKNKICLITGGNAGIGKETARQLAKLGAKIIIVCRNKEKGKFALEDIIATTNNPNIELMICDLAQLKDVVRFTQEFKIKYKKLHVLINNAGVFHMKRTLTSDGYESTFAINHLAHFYLTQELLPLLQTTDHSRIINLGSDIHKFFKIKMNDLHLVKRYQGQQAYSNSKSAMILFSYKLARDLKETNIKVYAVHPGHVKTQMTTTGMPKIFLKISDWVTNQLTPEEGARSSVFAASDNSLSNTTGVYVSKCKIGKSAKFTYDLDLQEELWKKSIEYNKAILG